MADQELRSPQDKGVMIDSFVLVGGASSRMGQDKSQMVIGGKKLFERAVAALNTISSGSISLAGGQSDQVGYGDFATLPDLHAFGDDPPRASIIGLYTALAKAKAPWIAVLACDLPFVTDELMIRLASFCSDDLDAIVPLQPDARPQPLCSFYQRKRCLPVVAEMLRTGDLKLQNVLSRITTRYVEFDEIADLNGSANFFLNINGPGDYETALKLATH